MKSLVVGPVDIGQTDSFERAFDIAFSKEALEAAHGGRAHVTPWKKGLPTERTLQITSPLPGGFPDILRRFLKNKDTFCMTVRQVCNKTSDDRFVRAKVDNKTKIHIVGSELLRMRSEFQVDWERSTGKTAMTASAKVVAWLPPPLKSIAESFVLATARTNIDGYFRAVSNIMSRDQVR